MANPQHKDLVIVGGGIGGVICLKYACDAGIDAVLLEKNSRVGGVWCGLPEWQDIQFRKEDWTLGDIPMQSECRGGVQANIQAWVDRFGLAPRIRLGTPALQAQPANDGWMVRTPSGAYRARYLISASGAHNVPVIPAIERTGSTLQEWHSSQLKDPASLSGRRVVVVGAGASAFDLLDLCVKHGAAHIGWVYRSLKWMNPTLRPKYVGTDMRLLAKMQILGLGIDRISRKTDAQLRARYRKYGLQEILPDEPFDFRRHQLVPGRSGMIREFGRIERHVGTPTAIHGGELRLQDGTGIAADIVLWGTGYRSDYSYLGELADDFAADARSRNLGGLFRSVRAPGHFVLAPAVLETSTSTPWAYAHAARTLMREIKRGGVRTRDTRIARDNVNHFDLVRFLAAKDRRTYPWLIWRARYLALAFLYPRNKPMPLP
jgi:hypothetical protein